MSDLFIHGEWVAGKGPQMQAVDPSNGDVTWQGVGASSEDVDLAVESARRAFPSWSRLPAVDRVHLVESFRDLVRERADQLTRIISRETGKPNWEAATEVAAMVNKVEIAARAMEERAGVQFADAGAARSVVRHRPHGVLAVFGPFNFPGHLPNGHIVPALLAGNTAVFKPSELTPATAEATVRIWQDSGLTPGVLNLVQGPRSTGEALAGHPGVDGVLFTGSAAVGHLLHRQLAGHPEKILALEMGGNNPLVVTETTAVDAAIYHTIQSAYLSAGQRCTCARRLLVPAGEWGDMLIARLAESVRSIVVGSPDDEPAPFMGPVVSEAAADRMLEAQGKLLTMGATTLVEMVKLRDGTGFLSPGLLDVTAVRDLPDEEYFGPLLQVIRYSSFDEAIDRANDTEYGLAAGILTDDEDLYHEFLDSARAGIVNWNRPLTGAFSSAPFGGVGASGNHRASAYYAADYAAYPVASIEADELALPETLPPGLGS